MNGVMIFRTLVAVALCSLTEPIAAQEQATHSPNRGHSPAEERQSGKKELGPPPDAYKACEGKYAGSRSEFTDPNGEVLKGFCENDGQGKIVLRPDRPNDGKPGGHHGPPPEAYAACVGKSIGGKAQFVNPRGETIEGVCAMEEDKLVLRPDMRLLHDGQVKSGTLN